MPRSRGKPLRPLPPVLHIYCEGEKTEPNYLNSYLDKYHPTNKRLRVIKIEKTRKNTPCQLVDEAVNKKKSKETPAIDLFWVVYDREGENYSDGQLHAKAFHKAKANNVKVALSNVCFEVWLLCHLEYSTAQYSCYDDLKHNSNLDNKIKELGFPSGYTKFDKDLCKALVEKVTTAKQNAIQMNQAVIAGSSPSRRDPYQLSPFTNVPDLLDAIDAAANTKKS
ncbi:MAG: hypothetical protein CO186_08540 [Zetaproteobacteria bacterium CG_4_9_14_3_um_filter_49_83]|nr:MAG: hypothetical protein AUJ56_10125 [Zetaproteobacteria bacterium CG1_02_49_23]PIQ31328.1 MAG: hypothetical protein COW62_09985 [Zetaproteobacteria bacterium CG17_big_fil_post_rev_8_21_14_2_50_50_13]PIV30885.1 MAG: hypothetical protein COS35_04315 [Zetaproteobacteria bacterium CG02_land_8_20_14_3_00_50_9]PIY55358.1 MAG: hypothetical protein COZ00_09740 [Zetaproteobacteria bacterium CG_4_10_14_0_8_um_filter_49_80]PJA34950.1 MAG: hypothetical protein CO186_08540 [Zetaproteobacteria bacterium